MCCAAEKYSVNGVILVGFAEGIIQISVILHLSDVGFRRVVIVTDLKPYFICIHLLSYTALKHTQKLVLSPRAQCSVCGDPQTSYGRGHWSFCGWKWTLCITPKAWVVMVWGSFMVWKKIKYALVITYIWIWKLKHTDMSVFSDWSVTLLDLIEETIHEISGK